MDKKNTIYLFMTSLLSFLTIKTNNTQDTFNIYNVLNLISHTAWKSFFFFTRIIGAIFMGNVTYCIQAIALFTCIIIIEAYIMHRLTKVTFSRAAIRMFIINIIHTMIALLVILLNVFSILITYKYFGIFVLLSIRMLISYFVYLKMDKQLDKKLLTKAIITTNSISFIITILALIFMKL